MSASAARRSRRGVGTRSAPVDNKTRAMSPKAPLLALRPGHPDYRPADWKTLFQLNRQFGVPDSWYGLCPAWRIHLESTARREFGHRLQVVEGPYALEYRVPLDVVGPTDLIDASVVFYAKPSYDTYDLPAQDYPRVWAQRGLPSKHRMPVDDALCLYYPDDPPQHRWTADKGLLDLLDLIVDHLGYEAHWRATGGDGDGIWLGDEAEHGFAGEAA